MISTAHARSESIKRLAAAAGFDRCGITALGPLPRAPYVRDWLARGRAGTMGYLHRRLDARLDPRALLQGGRSAVVVALNYHQPAPHAGPAAAPGGQGRVAMYAWGEDYHVVLKDKLDALVGAIRSTLGEPFDARICVDTSPLIERELAAAAGLGWIGKNTLVLHQEIGSYFFLGVILTTLDLAPDAPESDHCGSCTRCLVACPTDAFPAPYQMDATRCISYLTIEYRGDIPRDLQPLMGDWVFGCDVCQEVCPYNGDAPRTHESRFAVRSPGAHPSLADIAAWDESWYAEQVRGSAADRARLHMWKRNAAIAARNLANASVPMTPPPPSTPDPET